LKRNCPSEASGKVKQKQIGERKGCNNLVQRIKKKVFGNGNEIEEMQQSTAEIRQITSGLLQLFQIKLRLVHSVNRR